MHLCNHSLCSVYRLSGHLGINEYVRQRTDCPSVTVQTCYYPVQQLLRHQEDSPMSIATILLIILILLFLGMLPTWPHSRSWGYRPGGVIGIVILVLVILLLTGRIN